MKKTGSLGRFFNAKMIRIVGIVLVFFFAVLLLWHGNANSLQSSNAIIAPIYFEGEYRIADGPWQEISEGKHIPSTEGNVTLRGNFHMLAPDGEYVGIYTDEIPIAFYINHISLTIFEAGCEPYTFDAENPLFKDASCGEFWYAYSLTSRTDAPIEILIHNPHVYGNETAIDEMLSNIALWAGIDFEKGILDRGEVQRDIGLLFILVSLVFLGTALFATLIHLKSTKIIWVFGIVIFFAGIYFPYSADGTYFWRDSVVSNTLILGCSMMFYMLFLSMAIVHFLKGTKIVGTFSVAVLCVVDSLLFLFPILTDVLFYDTWLYWIVAQVLVGIVLFGCLAKEFYETAGKERWIYLGLIFSAAFFCCGCHCDRSWPLEGWNCL